MGLVWAFFFSSIIFLSPSLWETARYRLKYCLKGPLSPTQPTNPKCLNNWTLNSCLTLWLCSDKICSGPGCSKLTTSLVNVSLKFQTRISEIRHYFLVKKCEKLLPCKSFSCFFNKNISVFGYKVVKHLMS